jgi:hypothetical protein
MAAFPHATIQLSPKTQWRSSIPSIGNLCVSLRVGKVSRVDRAGSDTCSIDGTYMLARSWRGAQGCCHVGDALLPCALRWLRKRKPPSARVSFIALPAPLFGITSPNIRRPPPRCGRGVTGRPTPRLRRRGIVSRTRPPKLRRLPAGRRSKHPCVACCGGRSTELPVGLFVNSPVQPHLQNFSLSRLVETPLHLRIVPSRTERRFAIVADPARGMRWTLAAR